jgi:polar amino acid transport system permease protein
LGADGVTGAGAIRSPSAFGRIRDAWEAVGRRIPRRVKLGIVWLIVAASLLGTFLALGLDTGWMREKAHFIFRGIGITIYVSIAAILLAIPLALVGALGRLSKNAVPNGIAGFYTSFFRGTPLLVQLFFWYSALPQIALAGPDWMQKYFIWSPVVAGIVALGVNYGAYMTEIFRAGIQSVGGGQLEAAHALGMSFTQTMRRVVLPQALRVIIPPTGNEYIAMIKDTSLLSFISTTEIFWWANKLGSQDFRFLEGLIVAAAIYWILTSIFSFFQKRLERRFGRGMSREEILVLH